MKDRILRLVPTQAEERPVVSRGSVLKQLHPELDDAVTDRAGGMLDAVGEYLDSVPTSDLGDDYPAFTFDPVKASAYLPDPVQLPVPGPEARAVEPNPDELGWLPPHELAALVRAGRIEAASVRDWFAERIKLWQPSVNAFIRDDLDHSPAQHSDGLLAGVPIGLTDLIDVAGVPTTSGSALLLDHVAQTDAESWRRLSGQGALFAGKLNVHEFAAGTTGHSEHFGWVRNPWDTARMAGGACGGAGAAVATGMVSAALGPDPGGSIRVPAAHCGVVALKPTYGAIDRRGMRALTWTLDTLGVVAQRVAGVAAVADLLLDPAPSTGCLPAAIAGAEQPRLDGMRIGVPTSWIDMGLDPAVSRAFEQALEHLVDLGAQVREVDVPYAGDILRMHRAIAFSEASAGHAAFLESGAVGMGENIRDREFAGRAMLAEDYLKAFRIRGQVCRKFSAVWWDVDVIATPTVPVPALPIGSATVSTGSRGNEPTHTVYTRYAAPISTLGLPALSVPCGQSPLGLPLGLQLVGPPHAEPLLFFVSGAYEATTPWHRMHPSVNPEPGYLP